MSVAAKKSQKASLYPEGTTYSEWYVARELATFVVRREVRLPDGKISSQRAPRKNYSHHIDAYSERELEQQAFYPGEGVRAPRALEDFVIRLNGRDPKAVRLLEQVRYNHAWINDEFLQNYRQEELYASIQDRTNANALFSYLNRYALKWFLEKKKAHTVQSWKDCEREWGKYLANRPEDQGDMVPELRLFTDGVEDTHLRPQGRQLSAKVIKYTLFEMNRFIRYVYKKRRREFDDELVELEPWGKTFLDSYGADWRVKNPPRPTKYIKPAHWKVITDAMMARDTPWRFQVQLAHDYGLRRNETMGLGPESVLPSHLLLEKQLKKTVRAGDVQERTFKALKGREPFRKIPHWNSDAKYTRARIKAMLAADLPHVDTISEGFRSLCLSLADSDGIALPNYIFHDLRRTFITNAVKAGIPVEELRQATGHKDPQVLVKFYLMDARDLEDDVVLEDDDEDLKV